MSGKKRSTGDRSTFGYIEAYLKTKERYYATPSSIVSHLQTLRQFTRLPENVLTANVRECTF